MRLFLTTTVCVLLLTSIAVADDSSEIVLWPDGVPEPVVRIEPAETLVKGDDGLTRRFNVSKPRLFVYPPDATASATGAAIIVVPGGGFGRLADEHEGSSVCRWLASHGIVGIELAYRTPANKQPNPVQGPAQDLQKGILEVRIRSTELKIDPERIGVLGFSAGGQTALVAAASEPSFPTSSDPALLKPNALLLIYPHRIMDPETRKIRADVNLNSSLPPTFILQAVDDTASDPNGSTLLFSELLRRKIPAELHIYELGGHGFGMKPNPATPAARDWSHRVLDWLRLRKFALGNVPLDSGAAH